MARPNSDENDIIEWKDFCRQIGYQYAQINGYLNAEQWKIVRWKLVLALSGTRTRSVQIDDRLNSQITQNTPLIINGNAKYHPLLTNSPINKGNDNEQKKRKMFVF